MKEEHDDKTAYCRALGHYVPFRYCRTVSEGMPCRRIKDCWFETIDIEHYISGNFSESEIARIFAPPPDKISSLFDLIQKARGTDGSHQ
ncbi:MAG: hypothetical protein KA369_13090 [Spirochaetes bacterium]|nr:hypothetical protein [Spirochaetota bacterium]